MKGVCQRDWPRLRWLLACYPRSWRQRYGDEFTELLIAERTEHGRSWRHDANVAAAGLRARLASAGLASHPLDPESAARAGLAAMTVSLSAAGIAGVAIWSRLAIGLQWSASRSPAIGRAMDLLSVALAFIAGAGILAAASVAWSGVLAAVRQRARALRFPAALTAGGASVLVIGAGTSRTAGLARAATSWFTRRGFQAASPRSAGRRPCGSPLTGRIRPPSAPFRPGRSPGC